MLRKKQFTLTELLIVIVVVAILAALVMLNIKSISLEAKIQAFRYEGKIMQGVVDKYYLDKEEYPTVEQPSKFSSSSVDFKKLIPDFVKKNPDKERGDKYWVDPDGNVWFCTIDSPTGVKKAEIDGLQYLTWLQTTGSIAYNIYEVKETNGRIIYKSVKKIEDAHTLRYLLPNQSGDYVIGSVDEHELECAPVGEGYGGHTDTTTDNVKPVAVITMDPTVAIQPTTVITWGEASYDPDGDKIVDYEWENKKDTYPKGEHTVRLRVQDEHGLWSDWAEITFTVGDEDAVNEGLKPVAVIHMTYENPRAAEEGQEPELTFTYSGEGNQHSETFTALTVFEWNYKFSFSPNGLKVVAHEWENMKPSYVEGEHTVRLRVQDEKEKWSEWSEVSFTIDSTPPVAFLGLFDFSKGESVESAYVLNEEREYTIDLATNPTGSLLWVSKLSGVEYTYSPTGKEIVEESITGVPKYTPTSAEDSAGFTTLTPDPGQYILEYKVKDSDGLWSNTFKTIINVTGTPPKEEPVEGKPVAVLGAYAASMLDTDSVLYLDWTESYHTNPAIALVEADFVAYYYSGGVETEEEFEVTDFQVGQNGGNGIFVNLPLKGYYEIYLRIQDENGIWSDYNGISVQIGDKVKRVLSKPTLISNSDDTHPYYDEFHVKFYDHATMIREIFNCPTYSCRSSLTPPPAMSHLYPEDYGILVEDVQKETLQTYYNWEGKRVYAEHYRNDKNSVVVKYMNWHFLPTNPNYKMLKDGFTVKGNIKNPDGTIASNTIVTMEVYGIKKSVITDSNGDYIFTVAKGEIFPETKTKYVYMTRYSTGWADQATLKITSGSGVYNEQVLIGTYSLSGWEVLINSYMRETTPSVNGNTYYRSENSNIVWPTQR